MSKQSRDAKLIEFGAKRGYSSEQTATLLDKFNLLAPDLPEPSYVVTECEEEYPVWEATTRFRVEADPDNRDFYIFSDYEPTEPLSLAKVRTMRRALHAAETYMEEE